MPHWQLHLQEFASLLSSAGLFHLLSPLCKLSLTPGLWPILFLFIENKNNKNIGDSTLGPPCHFFGLICASSGKDNMNNNN